MKSSTSEPTIPHTKHLRVFHAVCRLGSMTKAADELRRAQSAVQNSIQQLEEALDVKLFERTTRGMLPTDAGKVLARRVEFAFEEMQAVRDALKEIYEESGLQPRNAPIFSLAVNERRLAVLVAFSEHKHMGAVAQQMNISQPAVSIALRDMEVSTGLALFDRSTSTIRLTSVGELLLVHIKRALTQLRLAVAEIAAMNGVMEGRVTIGALPFGRAYILPSAIANLHKRYPQLHFTTVEGPFETLTHGLWCGDIDLVLGALRPIEQYADLIREDLFSDRMVVIARAGHPLAAAQACTVREALDADWILPRRSTPTREVLRAAFETLGMPQPRVAVESSDLSMIRGLLLNSDMVTAASRHLFQPEIDAGSLVVLPIDLPETSRPIGILRRTQDHSSPGAQLLIEEIRSMGHMPIGAC